MRNELNFDSIKPMETIQTSFDHLLRENPMGETRKDALRLEGKSEVIFIVVGVWLCDLIFSQYLRKEVHSP